MIALASWIVTSCDFRPVVRFPPSIVVELVVPGAHGTVDPAQNLATDLLMRHNKRLTIKSRLVPDIGLAVTIQAAIWAYGNDATACRMNAAGHNLRRLVWRKHHRQPKLVRYLGLACKDQGPTGSGMINVTECRELAAECRQRLIARKPSGCDPFLSTPRERGTDWRSKSSTARQESPPRKCCARANKSWTLSISVTPRPKCVVMSRVLIGPQSQTGTVMRGDRFVGIVSRAKLLHGLVAGRTGGSASADDRKLKAAVEKRLSDGGVRLSFSTSSSPAGWFTSGASSRRPRKRRRFEPRPRARRG